MQRGTSEEDTVIIHSTASLCRATRCSVEHYAADRGYPPNIRRHHGPRSGAVCGSGGVSSVALLGSPDRLGGRLGVSWSLQGGDAFEDRGQLSAALGVGLALGLELLPERLVVGAHLGYECITLMGGGLFCPRVRHRVRLRAQVDVSAPIRSLIGAECATLAKSL